MSDYDFRWVILLANSAGIVAVVLLAVIIGWLLP